MQGVSNFKQLIDCISLMDVALNGCKFTWHNSFSKSRIDRALISCHWAINFPYLQLSRLPSEPLDHNPILLIAKNLLDWRPKPFRFSDA